MSSPLSLTVKGEALPGTSVHFPEYKLTLIQEKLPDLIHWIKSKHLSVGIAIFDGLTTNHTDQQIVLDYWSSTIPTNQPEYIK